MRHLTGHRHGVFHKRSRNFDNIATSERFELETPPVSEASITFGMQRHNKKSNLVTCHDAASYRAPTTELNSHGLSMVSNGKQGPSEKGIV